MNNPKIADILCTNLIGKFLLKVDFYLSVWLQEREDAPVGMRNLIILLSHRKVFLSVWSREKVNGV